MIDGLAIQVAVDPDMDLSNPYRVLARMLDVRSEVPATGLRRGLARAAGDRPQPRQYASSCRRTTASRSSGGSYDSSSSATRAAAAAARSAAAP